MSRLILPLPPSVNHSHKQIRRGKRLMKVKSNASQAFIRDAGWLTREWIQSSKWHPPDGHTKVIVRLWIFWPDKRKRDADNTLKITLDALKGIAFPDDRQALPQVIDFDVDKQNPRLEIEFEVMT